MEESAFNMVYSYTRAQAIEDGVLIDVTKMAKEAGIKFPTAVTSALWNDNITPSEELENQGQSIDGRLWDALFMFAHFARKNSSDFLIYYCLFQMTPNEEAGFLPIKALIGPGDSGEPVITLMLPKED
ncbi:MAG: hypothetical protein HQ557_00420 [Bacteroidetes bacterium]|nr:hypothetical protein [Bacteroidota bacterium]